MNYRVLHNVSSVDLLEDIYKRYRPRAGNRRSRVYPFERLITKREYYWSEFAPVFIFMIFCFLQCSNKEPFFLKMT